jgi:hypothetical protein
MNEPRNTGKWKRTDVPHTDWICVRMIKDDDLSFPSSGLCEMCEVTHIAHAHVMRHPQYPHDLCCGVICAGYMTDNPAEAERRDAAYKIWCGLRSKPDTGRLRRKGWHQFRSDNEYRFGTSGYWLGEWAVSVRYYSDVGWIGCVYYRHRLTTGADPADDWRLAALNAMHLVEKLRSDEAFIAEQKRKIAEDRAALELRNWREAVADLRRRTTDTELLAKIDRLPNDKPDYPTFMEIRSAWNTASTKPTAEGSIHGQTT